MDTFYYLYSEPQGYPRMKAHIYPGKLIVSRVFGHQVASVHALADIELTSFFGTCNVDEEQSQHPKKNKALTLELRAISKGEIILSYGADDKRIHLVAKERLTHGSFTTDHSTLLSGFMVAHRTHDGS
jgi:hypothetical protein